MVALKPAALVALTSIVSFTMAKCNYVDDKFGFALSVFGAEDCDHKDGHETFYGRQPHIERNNCQCFNIHEPLAGHIKSFVFTSGSVWKASVSLHEKKDCLGATLGFSSTSWMDKIVDEGDRGIMSAWICVPNAKLILGLLLLE
ncbi:hypothetical protein BV22DRAFT_1044877 [Leucogyrophana mollusca]|uniref:Uncharacterized protein n=1 Tax=Leucogyrophana mollusca TaxID=85980 RepID=A0ACB8BRJ6_9AGAM|nr:hypothetical protein BV22DRAFT_1044877 [Leucogyrophana mollusca]